MEVEVAVEGRMAEEDVDGDMAALGAAVGVAEAEVDLDIGNVNARIRTKKGSNKRGRRESSGVKNIGRGSLANAPQGENAEE